ncbi:MAG: OmpA family protein [Flavobacteriales bacterium]|nr:OmpA family protein [Flavobacteriales bacterium]
MATLIALFCVPHSYGQQYEIIPVKINSKDADFSAAFLGNDIVFCSARARVDLSFDDDSLTQFYTDLYLSKIKPDGTYTNPEALKGGVNTDFNEGHCTFSHDGRWMYYTANLKKSLDNKIDKTSEFKLGIFIAENVGGHWIPRGEFPFNSTNGKFSNAHPSLSPNDSVLYFCSNMPGGRGNSDIYRSQWINGQWSTPANLGEEVNSKGNEFFPFIDDSGTLYFSTDARNDSEGMDIYYSEETDGIFQEPERLNNTINSEYDEFAYQEKHGTNTGCFSSNRNEEQDDIFMFRKFYNNMNECQENYEANFCYHLFDTELTKLDSLPIQYEWDLGDGTIVRSSSINHCYKSYGHYHVTLNVVDTVTKMVFKRVSETDIEILQADRPYIHCHDSVPQHAFFEGRVDFTAFNAFPVKHIKWELEDGTTYHGESFKHQFLTSGLHQIKCAVTGDKKRGGITPFVCVYKNVWCEPADPSSIEAGVIACCDQKSYSDKHMTPIDNIQSKDGKLQEVHELVIATSKTKLRADDPLLHMTNLKVKETRTDSGYMYSVAQKSTWQELLPLYADLKAAGVQNMYAITTSLEDPSAKKPGANKADANLALHEQKASTQVQKAQQPTNSTASTEHKTADEHAIIEQPKESLTSVDPKSIGAQATSDIPANNTAVIQDHKEQTGQDSAGTQQNATHVATAESNGQDSNHQTTAVNTTEVAGATDQNNQQEVAEHDGNDHSATLHDATADNKTEKILYRIVLIESEQPLSFNDEKFKSIQSEINEIRTAKGYKYTILGVPAERDLNKRLTEIQANGLITAKAEAFDLNSLQSELVRKGFFTTQGDADRINIEFSKLSDIKFEYNSAEIQPESYKILNYIASMLILEEDFTLKIDAHTCSVGGNKYNLQLSQARAQAVMDYFISKGIDAKRLIPQGYGMERPFTTNESEMGRAANRRVEFTVVYSIKK